MVGLTIDLELTVVCTSRSRSGMIGRGFNRFSNTVWCRVLLSNLITVGAIVRQRLIIGIELARLARLPDPIINRAVEVAEELATEGQWCAIGVG